MMVSRESPMQWDVVLSDEWDVLGPFPIHAREQHFISPGFPLNLSSPYVHESSKRWPSPLSSDAQVSWTTFKSDKGGNLAISYPNIRWSALRSTEGWEILQHHSLLHTTLTVSPSRDTPTVSPRVLVELNQGSYFTIIPRQKIPHFSPKWYSGNIYSMNRAPPASVELPGSLDKDTVFDVFVSGDYEIRLFGDPRDNGSEIPILSISIKVCIEEKYSSVSHQSSHDVICDFVNGYAFGSAIGIGLRSVEGWWSVEAVETDSTIPNLQVTLINKQTIAPTQTRIVPLKLEQTDKFLEESLVLHVKLVEHSSHLARDCLGRTEELSVTLNIRQLKLWDSSSWDAIRATFLFASTHPTYFLTTPPILPTKGVLVPPILALHGAGVDVISSSFWAEAIPRQKISWIIMATGRTEWGLDWHGPSASEAFATIPALSGILSSQKDWESYSFDPSSECVLLGHSNGGQGVWYLTSRYPDRVRASIPAAGYLSAPAYVPLIHSHGARYADPGLRSVLESALTMDENPLFLSNIAKKVHVLAVHGGNDTNVPTWHSREYVSLIKSYSNEELVSLHIDDGQPHWYDNVFKSLDVQLFLDRYLAPLHSPVKRGEFDFVLTVADPRHSGSLYGWSITKLCIPGRIGKLHIQRKHKNVYVRTTNVCVFSVDLDLPLSALVIDGEDQVLRKERRLTFIRRETGGWAEDETRTLQPFVPPGRIQNIYDSSGPLIIIIPSTPHLYPKGLTAALRIAHSLDVLLKMDAQIIMDSDALSLINSNSPSISSNLIILGGIENVVTSSLLSNHDNRTEFSLSENGDWELKGQPLPRTNENEDIGILFTHPHPTNPSASAIVLSGTESWGEGMERALRLAEPRTGLIVPDWILSGESSDRFGIGGVLGAGVWSTNWKWNEYMSWTAS